MFVKFSDLTRTLPTLIAKGELKEVIGMGAKRLYSNRTDYLLRRDLSAPLAKRPQAKIPIQLRELRETDVAKVIKHVPGRLPAFKAGLRTCYVAVNEHDDICYMQWLIDCSNGRTRLRNFADSASWRARWQKSPSAEY